MSMDLDVAGQPWWLALLLTGVVALIVIRVARDGLHTLSVAQRRILLAMRLSVVALLMLAVAEPVLRVRSTVIEQPSVMVLIDQSLSMSARDRNDQAAHRLDEAITLGLLDPTRRPLVARQLAQLVRSVPASSGLAEAASAARRCAEMSLQFADSQLEDACAELQAMLLAAGDVSLLKSSTMATLIGQAAALAEIAQARDDSALVLGADRGSAVAVATQALERLDRAQRGVRWCDAVLMPALSSDARLRLVAMDSGLAVLPRGQTAIASAATLAHTSNPHPALAALARRDARDLPGAVVVVSDGRRTSGDDPERAARALQTRGVRVHTLRIGSPELDDAAILSLSVPRQVHVGDSVPMEVRWTARGRCDDADLVLTIDAHEELRIPAIRNRDEPFARTAHETLRIAAPTTPGTVLVRARLVPAGAAATSAASIDAWSANDEDQAMITVRAQALRCLMIDRGPRWDLRAIQRVVERELGADVRVFWNGDARAVLDAPWDLVVLGDVGDGDISMPLQRRLLELVSNGCGVLCVAGERAMPSAVGRGPLAELLPVRVSNDARRSERRQQVARRVAIPSDHSEHDLTTLTGDLQLDRTLWQQLAPLRSISEGVVAKPGAFVALHSADALRIPVVALHTLRAGRVCYVGAHDTWRWREHGSERWQVAFWKHALLWTSGIDERHQRTEELLDPRADPQALAGIALAGRGVAADLADTRALVTALIADAQPRARSDTQVVTLWDGWWNLLIICSALCCEWALRRRWGLP